MPTPTVSAPVDPSHSPTPTEDRAVVLRLRTLLTVISGAVALGMGYSSIITKQNEQATRIDALREDVRQLAAKVERLRDGPHSVHATE